MEHQIIIFELANEPYGVDIASVDSIIKWQPVTPVPHAPSFVEGVTNLRGKILPVIDLRKRFHLAQRENKTDDCIIVVSLGGNEVGMIVDAVSEVLAIADGVVEPPPPMVTTLESAFIIGIAKLDDRLVILLNLEKVLSKEEQIQLETVE